MENDLFRKKSLDHISSPEEMHDYMQVTSPRVWMILSAVLLLLAGFIVYIATTRMENTYSMKMEWSLGSGIITMPASQAENLKIHMPVRVKGYTGSISNIMMGAQIKLSIRLDSGEPLPDGFPVLTFENADVLPEVLKDANLTISVSNGLASMDEIPEVLEPLSKRDWRVRVDGNLGTLTDAEAFDAAFIYIEIPDAADALSDGVYDAEIVTESTTPISFLLN